MALLFVFHGAFRHNPSKNMNIVSRRRESQFQFLRPTHTSTAYTPPPPHTLTPFDLIWNHLPLFFAASPSPLQHTRALPHHFTLTTPPSSVPAFLPLCDTHPNTHTHLRSSSSTLLSLQTPPSLHPSVPSPPRLSPPQPSLSRCPSTAPLLRCFSLFFHPSQCNHHRCPALLLQPTPQRGRTSAHVGLSILLSLQKPHLPITTISPISLLPTAVQTSVKKGNPVYTQLR